MRSLSLRCMSRVLASGHANGAEQSRLSGAKVAWLKDGAVPAVIGRVASAEMMNTA
jgi:hypothetical protein